MKKSATYIIAIVVIVVIIIALVARKDTSKNESTSSADSSQTTVTPSEGSGEVAAVITYSDKGFSNSVDTVASGSTVKVVNQSQQQLSFASDPHPVHTDDPELNAGTIDPGDSKSFIVKTKGTWGFHNHFREQDEGSITIR